MHTRRGCASSGHFDSCQLCPDESAFGDKIGDAGLVHEELLGVSLILRMKAEAALFIVPRTLGSAITVSTTDRKSDDLFERRGLCR